MNCRDHDKDDDLCCQCEEPMPESIFDWIVGWGHFFCSNRCATEWQESA